MDSIGNLNIIQRIQELNDNLTLWLAESNDGIAFEVLSIKQNEDYQNLLNRILKNEIIPQINKNIDGIQKIVQVDYDSKYKVHYIVYEYNEKLQNSTKPTIKALKSILTGLDLLKKQNRFGFDISPKTLMTNQTEAMLRYVGLYELFKHQNILDNKYLAPEINDKVAPNFQSDIYSVFKCFEELLTYNQDSTLNNIFSKSLSVKRIDRFSKYSEILDELEKVKISNTSIRRTYQEAIKVIVKNEETNSFQTIMEEMNNSCYFIIERNLSDEKKQVTGTFTTKNYNGRFFSDQNGHIFIPINSIKNGLNAKIIEDGFRTEYGFDYRPNICVDSYNYFYKKWEERNTIEELNKTKKDLIKTWQTLPDKEKDFIEETAFQATYTGREESKSNPANIRFKLTDEFRNWAKLNELKRDEIQLSIDEKMIGKIQDYNPNDCYLIIKDAKITIDEIPEKGQLIQDVRMETSQFKKQVEACKKFESKNIVNHKLCSILATPERISEANRIVIDHDGFIDKVINKNLKTDDTQRDAVLEALHYKPVYLIQGPPGTGKTTVIVELIQQILIQNSNAKILVTSQSNLAVDNVLERLPDDILFMRLATDEDRISSNIKEHSYQSKLKNWVKETQDKSNTYFNTYFKTKINDKPLVNFYNQFSNINTDNKDAIVFFNKILRNQNQYIKELFENVKYIKDAEIIFNEKLGKEYQQLKKIQKDWFAYLSNVDTDFGAKKKSMLNDGSTEIDLQTAYVKSVNVIGATCIHIASGQYGKINFRFDYVIMDESSKATPAENLVPINMGENIVLIGDHKQLPPVITREEAIKEKVKKDLEDEGLDFDKTFGESLFEKLIIDFEKNPNLQRNIKMLDIQYRMPRQIGNLISRFFYDGKLKNPNIKLLPNFDRDKFHELEFKKPMVSIYDTSELKEIEVPNSIIFVSTSKQENPSDNNNKYERKNICNKNVITDILKQLNRLYSDNLKREKPLTIGIIAGYRGQVNLLQDIKLEEFNNFQIVNEEGRLESLIEINTVDKFQGAERDIIIYDIVKSSKESSHIGFLMDYRRINVAFSRVKKLLIVVGDSEYILKRASILENPKFKEFKLKDIVIELDKQGVIVNDLNEILK